MNRQPVKSSRLKSLGHDPAINQMEVEFPDGGVYRYKADTAAFTKLVTAKSIGQHFNANFGKQKGVPADPKTAAKEITKHAASKKPAS